MIPETSTTLLKDIADAGNARWSEFVARYRPMMLAYLKSRFPPVDADDAVQETLIALSKAIPNYRYAPDETGRFRNYLTGILRNKALKQCRRIERERSLLADCADRQSLDASIRPDGDVELRTAILEIAMRQLLDDDAIPDRSKQMFQRLVVDGVGAEEVANAYGTSRNNVDQTKSRMVRRLRKLVRALEAVADA